MTHTVLPGLAATATIPLLTVAASLFAFSASDPAMSQESLSWNYQQMRPSQGSPRTGRLKAGNTPQQTKRKTGSIIIYDWSATPASSKKGPKLRRR